MTESNNIKTKKKTSQVVFELGTPTIAIDKIEKYGPIYPRERISQKTIESYAEALQCGAKFPPVLLQKIIDEEQIERIIILDGFHRTEAYKLTTETEIPYEWYKEEILDIEDYLKELRIVCIKRNLAHGDRLSNSDKKSMCRIIAEEDIDISITEDEFADIFGVVQKTINNWISDIRTRQKGSRDNLIYRLSALGWTQQAIGEKINLDQSVISRIMQNSNFTNIHNDYKNGISVDKIAEYYGLDILMVWNILLNEKDDIERFNLFFKESTKECKYELYDIWNFQERDVRLGLKTDGNIAGQIIMNLLYYYTNQGDLVLDPMVGGGSTIDACLVMGRQCIGYDITPKREDIIENDSVYEIPELITKKKNADLIFLDPPYYDMVSEIQNYSGLDDFYEQIKKISQNCLEKLNDNGYIAIIMGNLTKKQENCLGAECYNILKNLGLKFINHISVPHSTQQYNAPQVSKFKKEKKILSINRDLYIFQK